ncbi:peptide-methionine (S)-S-oxide reductase [Mucilaginibacter sp. cycad4]|nr:peptide-methionine (S)-S-oxide reductase [Mucilaginibacter gossypii]WPV02975.1 peptide-methionine (S)-S-oxide reductase [Mucilaginibacter gossypii]
MKEYRYHSFIFCHLPICGLPLFFKWPGKIVTEVVPATDFWIAEAEHQDYLQKNPYGYTCHFERPDWKLAD